MPRSGPLLTEQQWKKIEPLLPSPPQQPRGGSPVDREPAGVGRHPVDSAQRCTLEVFAQGVSPSVDLLAQTAGLGGAGHLVEDLAQRSWENSNERQQLKWSESFVDGSFAPAKKGATKSAKPSGARGRSGWWWSTARVFLWESTWTLRPRRKSNSRRKRSPRSGSRRAGRPRQRPQRMIGDKAYDSDPLRKRLHRRGIELIAPHKRNRVRPPTQDGRALRRYRHRWIVERTIAWLGNFRRLVVRWDRSTTIYQAFFHIACLMIVLRKVVQ